MIMRKLGFEHLENRELLSGTTEIATEFPQPCKPIVIVNGNTTTIRLTRCNKTNISLESNGNINIVVYGPQEEIVKNNVKTNIVEPVPIIPVVPDKKPVLTDVFNTQIENLIKKVTELENTIKNMQSYITKLENTIDDLMMELAEKDKEELVSVDNPGDPGNYLENIDWTKMTPGIWRRLL